MKNIVEEIKRQYDALVELLATATAEANAVPEVTEPDLTFLKGIKEKLLIEQKRLEEQEESLNACVVKAEDALRPTEEALETIENLLTDLEFIDD